MTATVDSAYGTVMVTFDNLPPSVGTFEPNFGSGRVGEWVTFTTTYNDPNGYEDITWAFFFLDRAPPIASGGLTAAYVQSADSCG